MGTESDIERVFHTQLMDARAPEWEREFRFCDERRWRFDFAWPDAMLAIEVEGATWSGGRHTRGAGYESDCRKYNTATLEGWSVMRFTGGQVKSGEACRYALNFLGVRP